MLPEGGVKQVAPALTCLCYEEQREAHGQERKVFWLVREEQRQTDRQTEKDGKEGREPGRERGWGQGRGFGAFCVALLILRLQTAASLGTNLPPWWSVLSSRLSPGAHGRLTLEATACQLEAN